MSETQHHHPLVARNVKFQWENTPHPWLPGDSFTSHFINVLHLLLPEGELWFCRLYNQALPDIEDETLRADVKGFIRQEAIHSRSHQVVLDRYFADNGIVTEPYTRRVRWLFTDLLGDHPFGIATVRQWIRRAWLTFRLGLIAAIEHF
ncbi:MAG: metal-dependent hydrolase, partial [Pseudomonadota bacterium]